MTDVDKTTSMKDIVRKIDMTKTCAATLVIIIEVLDKSQNLEEAKARILQKFFNLRDSASGQLKEWLKRSLDL